MLNRFFYLIVITGLISSCTQEMKFQLTKFSGDENLRLHDRVLYYGEDIFSGKVITVDNGDTISIENYKNGFRDGRSFYYYRNGSMNAFVSYRNGMKNGSEHSYYPTGLLKSNRNYSNDQFDGISIEWYPDGPMYRKMNYENGKEKGMQQVWNADGSYYANYEMKDGRKYGLTGTKHCVNENIQIN